MDLAIDPVFGLTGRLLTTLIFGGAALHKLRGLPEFRAVLENYRILPAPLLKSAVGVVIAAETFAALAIWWPALRVVAATTAVVLLVAYALAIALNLYRGRREIDCGCSFGNSAQPLSWALPLRNALLVVPCAIAGLGASTSLPALGVPVAFFAATALAILYLGWGALLANRPQALRLRDS